MNETENRNSCCENSGSECNCVKPVNRKPIKVVISLAVLLAVVSIIAYKILTANYPDNTVTSTFGSFLPFSGTAQNMNAAIQQQQNLGEYLESISDLNIIAFDNDTVFVYIPGLGNALIDDKAKETILNVQQYLKRDNIAVGLYTLSHNSPEYSDIAKHVKLPVLMVANKGSEAYVIPGNNIDEYTLLTVYQACCDSSSDCCN